MSDMADVMAARSSAVKNVAGHVVKDLKRMKEHILVTAAIDGLNALQGCEFREYEFQQSASVQINESLGGNG